MANKCPTCHSDNPETVKFCGECGTPLPPPKDPIPVVTETLRTPVKELTRGTLFARRFEVIEELGKGGMGRVYRAFDQKVDEEVALKLIKPEIAAEREVIDRFRSELKMSRKISHRNVSRMYDLGDEEGTHYITMEYVPGEDLKSFIYRSKQLSTGTALAIARQVCEGLEEAHRLGVVHRDLKPSNIMIDKEGNAKIMDFGIARSLSGKGITGAGMMIGTPEYMSPEQVEGKDVDQRSDIYSLGVVLYEMVTGRRPFEGDTPLSVAHKQKYEAPEDPKKLNALLPEDLSRVILRCLEKDKGKRYQTAEELRSDLTPIEEKIPTTDRRISQKESSKSKRTGIRGGRISWSRISPYAGVAVVLALIVYAGLHLFPSRREVIDSIAVLPFENVNADPNTDYLCDGITETVINKLSQLSSFKTVICRNSAFTYKGKSVDPKKVGRELGVKAILLTRLVRRGDRLTISPTLVRAKDNSQLWGERYDQEFEDIFSIEENMATSIVQALRLKLTEADKHRISKRPIDNAAAYECYLRARREISRVSEDALNRALLDLQNGIRIIGDNALLYCGMAEVYFQFVNIGAGQEELLMRSEEWAKRALALDPNLPEAYHALADPATFRNYPENFQTYFHNNKRALTLDPNLAPALASQAEMYIWLGKPSRALPLLNRLKQVDPLNPGIDSMSGYLYLLDGKYTLAIERFTQRLQFDPNPFDQFYKAWALAYNKEIQETIRIVDQSAKATPNHVLTQLGLLLKYGLLKDREKAFQVMTPDFQKTCRRDFVSSYCAASLLSLLDAKKEALDWLENAVKKGFINYPALAEKDPFLANIRGEERFKKLLKRVKYEWEHFEL